MTIILFLWIAPAMCFVTMFLQIIAFSIWQNFARVDKSVDTGISSYPYIAGRVLFVTMLISLILIPVLLSNWAGVSGINILQLTAIALALLVCSMLFNLNNTSVDHVTFCAFAALSSIVLILSQNLITIFFTLELLNMLVIYSFFFNAGGAHLGTTTSAMKIAASCVYQFILNFFSSIVLYCTINWYISLTGGASLANVAMWQLNDSTQAPICLMLAAFLLKFGSGPWIFFKINIYRNMNYVTASLYTVVYLLVVLIFFLNLIFLYGLKLSTVSIYAITMVAGLATIAFSSLAFQSINFFVFLSFSSLINITVFLLQAMSALSVWIAQE